MGDGVVEELHLVDRDHVGAGLHESEHGSGVLRGDGITAGQAIVGRDALVAETVVDTWFEKLDAAAGDF